MAMAMFGLAALVVQCVVLQTLNDGKSGLRYCALYWVHRREMLRETLVFACFYHQIKSPVLSPLDQY